MKTKTGIFHMETVELVDEWIDAESIDIVSINMARCGDHSVMYTVLYKEKKKPVDWGPM